MVSKLLALYSTAELGSQPNANTKVSGCIYSFSCHNLT